MKKFLQNAPGILFLFLLTITGLIPNFGAIDRIGTQWLYLSVLNTLGLFYVFFTKGIDFDLKLFYRFKPLALFSLFTFWSLLSFFYSLNGIESLVKFFRIVNIPVSLYIILIILKNYKFNVVTIISIFVVVTLIIELYFPYSTFFQLINYTKYDFSYAYLLKGATGNKNIAAASILIKIPFIFYLTNKIKHVFFKFLLSVLIFSSSYLIFILSARASILSIITILILSTVFHIYTIIKNKKSIYNKEFYFNIIPIVLSIFFFQAQYSENNSASIINRVSTINEKDESTNQRLRFYKHSLDQIIQNPIIGVGSGNWKIASVEYDKENINGYTIPYHTHNDFLEIGSELGIIGLFIYLMIFIIPLKDLLKRLKTSILKDKVNFNIDLLILFSGVVFFIDSNLNFPHARPVNIIPFLIILSFLFFRNNQIDKT